MGAAGVRWERADLGRAGFTGGSDRYERGRPGYPAELFDRLCARRHGAAVAVDVAAGTGKFTRSLDEAGLRALGIEPSATMRAEFAAHIKTVPVIAGSAEALPLGARCADLVTVAQAFHWFDAPRAIAEMARVTVPGGDVALAWNMRDERVGWVAQLSALLYEAGTSPRVDTEAIGPLFAASGAFEPVEHWTIEFGPVTTRVRLLDDMASRSYVNVLPDVDRERFLARLEHFTESLPECFAMPYLTEVFVARRR